MAMKNTSARKSCLLAAVLSLSSVHANAASDELSTMFEWWNSAFTTTDGFNAAAFARYYTPDARLVIDGVEQARGIDAWVQHFRKIQASGAQVEIVLPFRHAFKQGDKIYTYHVIRSVRNGVRGCMLAAGHALLVKGKISEVNLVRAPLEPAQAAQDPACTGR
jgi:ketosteroid isomerase-like protein